MDVIRTRKGITIEIGNTDAEGRVILCDALAEAVSENPALIVDFATLTGAARVALGAELPALFANDDTLAAEAMAMGAAVGDPVWHMPLWKPYRRLIEGRTADITNNPDSPQGGAITAALFLAEFVGAKVPWAHLDVMAWNPSSRPGRPEGGEAMGMRAFYEVIAARFAK
jgi:leucyl aminopeptidase